MYHTIEFATPKNEIFLDTDIDEVTSLTYVVMNRNK
jgi:hypothetical protein